MPEPKQSKKKPTKVEQRLAGFEVYERGDEVDIDELSTERWAENLSVVIGWAINEEGDLILMDDDGRYATAPPDRFEIRYFFEAVDR